MTEGMWEAGDWGPLERFVAEEYVVDTLWAFEPGFRRGTVIPAAEQLGTLPLPGDHPERWPIFGGGDALRGDARASSPSARRRVLPRRDPGSVQDDPDVP